MLTFQKLKPADWRALQKLDIDFKQSPYAKYDTPWPNEAQEFEALTAHFASTDLFFLLYLDKIPIGYVCFYEEEQGVFELAYLIHSAHQGKGYATVGCQMCMDWLCENEEVTKFTAGTAKENMPSVRVLQKLGFEKTEEAPANVNDFPFLAAYYERQAKIL